MKYTIMIACLLSASCATVHCMEEKKPFLPLQDDNSHNNPPSYYTPPVSAPNNNDGRDPESRQPQGSDVYMTYLEWWDKNEVPADVRSKSVREQEIWRAETDAARDAAQRQALEQDRAKELKEQEGAAKTGFLCGACVASVLCLLTP